MIFVGDDWAEEHHDVYLMNEAGERLASGRLPEGLAGITRMHELIAALSPGGGHYEGSKRGGGSPTRYASIAST
jgi:hypothetical protein